MYEIGSCFWNGLKAIFSFLKFAVKAVAEIYDKLGDGIFLQGGCSKRQVSSVLLEISSKDVFKGCVLTYGAKTGADGAEREEISAENPLSVKSPTPARETALIRPMVPDGLNTLKNERTNFILIKSVLRRPHGVSRSSFTASSPAS